MAAKRPVRRTTKSKQTLLDKYGGALKLFANYGFAGLAFGYLLMVTVPDMQKSFTASLEKQAEQNREDRKNGWEHGERAVEKLSSSVDRLGDKFGSVQATTQSKQDKIITGIEHTNEILSRQLPINPAFSPSISNHRNEP